MDENNKELNISNIDVNSANGIDDTNNINNNVTNNEAVIPNENISSDTVGNDNQTSQVVEEVSFNYPENENISVVDDSNVVVEANTNVEVSAPVSVSGTTIQEVSVSGTSLDEVETSSNSVFNDKSEDVVSGSMKEGQEHRAEKKGIPYGMLIGFGILIVCAFFIEEIVGFVENYLLPKDEVVEESKKDDKETVEKDEKDDKDEVVSDNSKNDDTSNDDISNNDTVIDNNDNSNSSDLENDTDNSVNEDSFNEGE